LFGTSLEAALFVLCLEKRDHFHTVDGVAYIDAGGGNASYCCCDPAQQLHTFFVMFPCPNETQIMTGTT
jgi:hypothetical protein